MNKNTFGVKLGKTALTMLSMLLEYGPRSRRELLVAVRPLYGSKNWGNSYFLVGRGNGRSSSLVLRELIVRTRPGVYAITRKGALIVIAILVASAAGAMIGGGEDPASGQEEAA